MFLNSKSTIVKLSRLDHELALKYQRAVARRQPDAARDIAQERRRVRRLILLHQEFAGARPDGEPTTVADILARYS